MKPCPSCGKPTDGTWTEGGLRWDLCPDCSERVTIVRVPRETPGRRVKVHYEGLDYGLGEHSD